MAPKRFQEPGYVVPRRPGRPRKEAEPGHNMGTVGEGSRMNKGDATSAVAIQANAPIGPRLLDLHSASTYIWISQWTIRDLESAGVLRRVRIPLPNDKEMRKLLFDKQDLDSYIEKWKDSPCVD